MRKQRKNNNVGAGPVSAQRGITLIALIITIIVMLILAGVTINLTLGENGIFTTAQQAAQNYTDAQNKEMAELGEFTNTVNNIIEGKTLTSQITGEDYGKAIDYSVTVEGTVLDDWKVFYNDKTTNNVYIILDGYLPNTLIPEATGITTTGTYQAYWENVANNTEAVATLTNTTYWSAFAGGVTGATATGGPTNEMFVNSWNENSKVNSTLLTVGTEASGLTDSSKLYTPYTEVVESCYGYWLVLPSADDTRSVWYADCNGRVYNASFASNYYGVRPLVCLPSGIIGTVGDSVSMDK